MMQYPAQFTSQGSAVCQPTINPGAMLSALTRARENNTILLVEDNADDVVLVKWILKKNGLEKALRAVSDGHQAIEYLQGTGRYWDRGAFPVPSLLILDLVMPAADGFSVLKWVRVHPRFKRLPVVVFTGSPNDDHASRAYDLGANSVVVKPTAFEEFHAAIRGISDFWLTACKLPAATGAPPCSAA